MPEEQVENLEAAIASAVSETESVVSSLAEPAPKPFGDRELDFELDAKEAVHEYDGSGKGEHSQRRALFRLKNGNYCNSKWDEKGTVDRSKAIIATVDKWYALASWGPDTVLEILLDAPKVPPKPREYGFLSDLEQHFPPDFIALIESAPDNPLVRAHMMKQLKVMPDESLDTFEKLKEWVQKTFPPPTRSVPKTTAAKISTEMSISFGVSDTEHGHCRYSVNRYGTYRETVSLALLQELINDDGRTLDGVLEYIEECARDNNNADMEWSDNGADYDRHGADDTGDEEFSFEQNIEAVKNSIIEFLRQHDPETLETLNEN